MWTYDDAGNILSRKEYAYTTGTLGTVLDTVNYSYGNSNWGDLLTAYDGHTITHDGIGNPLTDGTWTYTWEHGRELMTMSGGGTTWTYTYDANGVRTKRTNGSTTYSYVYNGSSLSQMTVGSNTLNFAYDASGTPMAVTYNGTNYYYVTNLQGDVVAILNSSGTSVVTYTYDAWGNVLTTSGSMASTLGVHNPLRYRGYVYDTETELYYLQSRYYDPQVGRFINADALVSTGQGLLSNNMFVYCLNCPIMGVDLFGTRTYFINGISNRNKEGPPEYANAFEEELENAGVNDVIPIAVYNGLSGFWGNIVGGLMVFWEMLNMDVYTNYIVEYILTDLENNPLKEGEQLNIIGYSGGGQLALNVMEKLDGKVDNVVLIGAPVLEISITTTNISYLYSESDIFSWKPIFGIRIYDVGPLGHEDYFKQKHIGGIAETVAGIID